MGKRMSEKEWKALTNNIVGGIFGGLVVTGWTIVYGMSNNFTFKLFVPAIFSVIFFVLMIIFLRWIFVGKTK